jgi:hypothetical protein
MPASTLVPVTITPEAAARIARLHLQPAVDRMIAYARQHLPEVARIEVILYDRYDLGDEPGLAVEVYSTRPFDPADRSDNDMVRWLVTEFPPEVLEHVIVCYRPGTAHAG